jgi:hypothetical protein
MFGNHHHGTNYTEKNPFRPINFCRFSNEPIVVIVWFNTNGKGKKTWSKDRVYPV